MAQAPRTVHDRLATRLKFCAHDLTNERFLAAITHFQHLCERPFILAPRDPGTTSELLEKLALERPVHEHMTAADSSTYTLPLPGPSPVFAKLDDQLAKLGALEHPHELSINNIPDLLLQAMARQESDFKLIHHTPMHGAEVAHNSVWTLKHSPWHMALTDTDQKQSLENLLFLIGCAHDSIFTRERGYDEAASALLLIHLLNLDSIPDLAMPEAQQDLIKIIYYTIVGGTDPIFPKGTKAMIVLGHQVETDKSSTIAETPNSANYSFRGLTPRRLIHAYSSNSHISPLALAFSDSTLLLSNFRKCIAFADVNLHSNSNLVGCCATPQEEFRTAASESTDLSARLKIEERLREALFATIKNTYVVAKDHPSHFNAALLCLGQGIRVALEESWVLDGGTFKLKTLMDNQEKPHPPALIGAIQPLTDIYKSLVAARHAPTQPILNDTAHAALYSDENIKNMLRRLIVLFNSESSFAGSFLANGFDSEFSKTPFVGTNFWPMASAIYAALEAQATQLIDQPTTAQREFILNIMCIASYQHGGAIAQSIMSPSFDIPAYTHAIGALQRTGLDQVLYPASPTECSTGSTTMSTAGVAVDVGIDVVDATRRRMPTYTLPSMPAIAEEKSNSAARYAVILPRDQAVSTPQLMPTNETLPSDADAAVVILEPPLGAGALLPTVAAAIVPVVAQPEPDHAAPDFSCGCFTALLTWWRGNNVAPEPLTPRQ